MRPGQTSAAARHRSAMQCAPLLSSPRTPSPPFEPQHRQVAHIHTARPACQRRQRHARTYWGQAQYGALRASPPRKYSCRPRKRMRPAHVNRQRRAWRRLRRTAHLKSAACRRSASHGCACRLSRDPLSIKPPRDGFGHVLRAPWSEPLRAFPRAPGAAHIEPAAICNHCAAIKTPKAKSLKPWNIPSRSAAPLSSGDLHIQSFAKSIQSASDRRHMTCAIVHAMELTAFGRVHLKRRDGHGPRPGEHLAVPRGNAIAPQAKRRRSSRHARPCARYRPRTQAPRRTSGRRDTPLARLHDCGRSAERLCHTHIYHSRPRHGMLPETGMAPDRPPLCAA